MLAETGARTVWQGDDGGLPGRVLLLADDSTFRVDTGRNPWARTDPDRPLQMWTVGAIHLDDGPLTPAASTFLTDLSTALQDADVGHPGPSSEWLAQRATLDPRSHAIAEVGVARPHDSGADVRVWDAARGWVPAAQAGGLATVVDEGLVTAGDYASWPAEPSAGQVLEEAARLRDLLRGGRDAELQPGTAEHAAAVAGRARQRRELHDVAKRWAAGSVGPALTLFLDQPAHVLARSRARALLELPDGVLAVVTVASAEAAALPGSRPGLQQAGTTADIGRLRNELADVESTFELARDLTRALQERRVRHFRVQGVLTDDDFVGTRVTEFEVIQPAHDAPDILRSAVEPQRYIDPGLAAHEAMARATAGWTPASPTEAIANALRWLPHVNPHHRAFTPGPVMPWSNNCGDCSRAVADLVQGRDARTAFGDNAARHDSGWTSWQGRHPGELAEMWAWAGVEPQWFHRPRATSPARFTEDAYGWADRALSGHPAGTVAIVLVNWADKAGEPQGGHWFDAVVTEDGVHWVDGQTAEHRPWPPPYPTPLRGISVITRAPGSDTWLDLYTGPAVGTDGSPRAGVGPGDGGAPPSVRRIVDPTFAVRIANATGDWPDDEDDVPDLPGAPHQVDRAPWPDGAGSTSTVTLTIESPGGQRLPLVARWVERTGLPPVLVLSELPGQRFWWGAPDAVLQAVDRARAAFQPDSWAGTVVLGQRAGADGEPELAQFRLDLGAPDQARTAGPPRPLPPEEAAAARSSLRLPEPPTRPAPSGA